MVSARRSNLTRPNVERVPATPGVYVLFGTHGAPAFVGRARSLRARLTQELESGRIPARSFSYTKTATEGEAAQLERALIVRWLPRFNIHHAA